MTLAFLLMLAALPAEPVDSQAVLQHYQMQLARTKDPQTMIFTYAVSQAGPQDIDQTHRVYRSGNLVRDETLLVDGVKQRFTRISRYRNRYTLHNLAPASANYAFVFVRVVHAGKRKDYLYRTFATGGTKPFAIESMTIDGATYLPREIRFRSIGVSARGTGVLTFLRAGKYWVPGTIAVRGKIGGKTARERIIFGSYQFPPSLPKSTFQSPKPLPSSVLLPAY